jgi:hypothetical protein
MHHTAAPHTLCVRRMRNPANERFIPLNRYTYTISTDIIGLSHAGLPQGWLITQPNPF